ncbi:Panacea domain-containing protein [Psychrobacillus sp. FSL H8-0510]|uniref:Panacea domain-containing protein n=1 Tax=Psychrobacillus sp. FSL H8-0510 TaxID=2921394 RepID=UPI0030FC5F17
MRWLFDKKGLKKTTAADVASFIVHLCNKDEKSGHYRTLQNVKMQKLLYYCQGYSYYMNQKPLFRDYFEAWPYGPSIPRIHRRFSIYGQNDIHSSEGEVDLPYLTDEEKKIIEHVWDDLGNYNVFALVNATLLEDPWKLANEKGTVFITPDSIHAYFNEISYLGEEHGKSK